MSERIHRTRLDPGDGREITQQITIKVWSDGALSVEGPVEDTAWCLAAMANAADAVRNHRRPSEAIVIPSYDVDVIPALHPLKS